MFLDNKYTNIYKLLIERALKRDCDIICEKHHIVPKSLGGNNANDNLVLLTPREHMIAHKLLVKMTYGENKRKMSYALWSMIRYNKRHKRQISSRDYEYARKVFIENHPSKNLSVSEKLIRYDKVSNSLRGRPKSKEHRKHISESLKRLEKNNNLKRWKVTFPSGETTIIENLNEFCRNNCLSAGNMSKHGKSKGYTVECLGHVKTRTSFP